MFRTRNSQKFIMGDKITADMRVNSEHILCSSQSHGMKRCKGKMSPFRLAKDEPLLLPPFTYSLRPRAREDYNDWAPEYQWKRRFPGDQNGRRAFKK